LKDEKLKQILELRKRVNLSGGRKAIALSSPANEFMSSGATSPRFWSAFAKKYPTLLKNATVRKDDARRMEAAHEGTVDVHFNGEYGVIATARKHGIMDDRGVLDKTRIVNTDESPQFVAFDGGKGNNERVQIAADQRQATTPVSTTRARVRVCVRVGRIVRGLLLTKSAP
jgi:hypothetical protein